MSLRREFVKLALAEGQNLRLLSRRFHISPTTGYKWIRRYLEEGDEGLRDRPRRPVHSPNRTSPEMEELVLEVRREHPDWGGRKINARLIRLGHAGVPQPGTITAILRRHSMIDPVQSAKRKRWQRFEHERPNSLWQMDFKGHFPVDRGRCHPLTVLDDHSRFSLAVEACSDEQTGTVKERLTTVFRSYGLPERMLMDNGPPWGSGIEHPHTPLTLWLMRLGVRVSHGRPYHPQTQGKDERFHRTLISGVINAQVLLDIPACQRAFDRFRDSYNFERPHEGIGLAVPADRYRVSPREFPEALPALEYGEGVETRKVWGRMLSFKGRKVIAGKAFSGHCLGLAPGREDGVWEVYFGVNRIGEIDLRVSSSGPIRCVHHVSKHVSTMSPV